MTAAPDRERGVLRCLAACDIAYPNVASQAGCGVASTMLGRLVSGGAPGAREREEDVFPSLDMKIVSLLSNVKRKIDNAQKISPCLLRDCSHTRRCETKANGFNPIAFNLTIKCRIIPAAVRPCLNMTGNASTAAIP